MSKRDFHQKKITGLISVTDEEVRGDADKMVRRFIKKVKAEGLMEEIKERSYYKSPSLLDREKRRQTKRLIQNVNKKREELFKPKDRFRKKRR